jgi:uncharacterized protein (TIGR03083 family)
MPEHPEGPQTKAGLLQRIDQSWRNLETLAENLTADQWEGPTDAAGWTVKDHVAHLAAWERSMLFLLEGNPPWDGAGVSQEDFFSRDYDASNEVIRQQHRAESPEQVWTGYQQLHEEMKHRIAATPEDRLALRYSEYITGHPGKPETAEPTMIAALGEDTWQAYDEHLSYINRILAG